ncbi:hypothetical protein ABIA16_003564 [Sinorhizobium fredii]
MFVSVPFPSNSSGGGSTSGYVQSRFLLIDTVNERDFLRLLSSTSKTVADIVALAQAVEPGVTADNLRADFMIFGSGGAGASGPGTGSGDDATVWGGYPSHPVLYSINLSEIDPSEPISFDIGAVPSGQLGAVGLDGNPSSISLTRTDGSIVNMISVGGFGGQLSTILQRQYYVGMSEYGLRILDPTVYAPLMGRIGDSPFDPGTGAPFSTSITYGRYGGFSNSASFYPLSRNSEEPDGFEHFLMSGAGGFSSLDLNEGTETRNGGSPGGGGGAGNSSVGHVGGAGGAGEIRIRLSVMEPA